MTYNQVDAVAVALWRHDALTPDLAGRRTADTFAELPDAQKHEWRLAAQAAIAAYLEVTKK